MLYLVIELSCMSSSMRSRAILFVRVTRFATFGNVLSEPFPWAEALSFNSTTALNSYLTGSWRYIHHGRHVQRRLP
jgi:hypothetical protein